MKDAKEGLELKDLTLQEILDTNAAIKRVRDTRLSDGSTLPGCTFPFKIMYKNGKIEGQIKTRVKAFTDAKKEKIEKHQVDKETGELDKKGKIKKDKAGKPLIGKWLDPKLSKKIEGELKKEVEAVESDIILQPYLLSWFLEMEEDEYYREANKNSPIPQEFFSLLGRMIIDDTNEKKEEEKKDKS
jgi:hypothetical protein